MSRKSSAAWLHGRYATYKNHGCRCEPCKLAWKVYKDQRKLARWEMDHVSAWEAHKTTQLASKYGITLEYWREMYISQGGGCAICEGSLVGYQAVDHDHKTGQIRGLLCRNCNLGLGLFKDQIKYLIAAAEYLRYHRRVAWGIEK